MVSGSAASLKVAVAVAVFTVLVMSSQGHPRKKPLCSDCGSLCNANCTAMVTETCRNECNFQFACDQCKSQVRQACCQNFCSSSNGTSIYSCCPNGCVDSDCATCSCDYCDTGVENSCTSPCSDRYCRLCTWGIEQQCLPSCISDCNNNCVKKDC
ncbi:hypothetical protein PVAP13_8KG305100 [Panicum virgatum]|uniref:Uncharacterized protein n=1 Tax=Panicum virgatum TaxID=38727 RepID=A0A8T0PVI7_PANVG|nr:hypothetical protein PVAP13_8KG305100 [Panicum virgatum]